MQQVTLVTAEFVMNTFPNSTDALPEPSGGGGMAVIRGVLTIDSELIEVSRARDWISALTHQAGLSSQESYELQLVLSEACTNAIKHAYGMEKNHPVELSAAIDDDQVRLIIRDFGRKMDPQEYRAPNLEICTESGYGIYVMQSLMDEVHFDVSHDKGTELTLVKYRSRLKNADTPSDSRG